MVVREPLPHILRQHLFVLPCMIEYIFFSSIYMFALMCVDVTVRVCIICIYYVYLFQLREVLKRMPQTT